MTQTCITINIILKKEASVNHNNSYRKEIKCQTLARSTIIAAFSYMTRISKMSVAIYYFARHLPTKGNEEGERG
jgi:hypothetical protein